MHFKPKFKDGRKVSLPWELLLMEYLSNILVWPLASNHFNCLRALQIAYSLLAFLLFTFANFGNLYFLYKAYPDVLEMGSCFTTYLALMETHIRIAHMTWFRKRFKDYLQVFFADIYIEKKSHPEKYKAIRLKLYLVKYVCISYVLVLFSFLNSLLMDWINGKRDLMFKQDFPYEYEAFDRYIPHMMLNFWIAAVTVSQFVGEAEILASGIMHLSGRYELLEEEMVNFSETLKVRRSMPHYRSTIAVEFQTGMLKFIKRNEDLNYFVGKIEEMFSFRLFVTFSTSSLLFCVILLNLVENGFDWKNSIYVFWFMGKLFELLVVGEYGSTLLKTTDNLTNMYYHSNWEMIISESTNTKENLRAMKLVLMAMQINSRSIGISGLKFFQISIGTVITIIQAAFSYFTFLGSVK